MWGMKLKSVTFDDFCVHLNQNENQATAINVNIIFNKSNIRLQLSYPTAANRYCKVRCETSPQRSLSADCAEAELHQLPWQALEGLVRCPSNYVPLSPISFLERAGNVYRTQTSVVYGSIKYTWEETHLRCIKLASALHHLGVSRGDVVITFPSIFTTNEKDNFYIPRLLIYQVATLVPNIPAMLELHFAIPMAGGTICPLNTCLDPDMLSILLKHSEARILFIDYQLLQIAMEAINLLQNSLSYQPPLLVIISEPNFRSPWKLTCKYDYESLINSGFAEFTILWPNDESDPIILNYTFGITSEPKVIVYSHRVAYLNSLASIFMHGMQEMSTYLWSFPMFHCHGCCFTWGIAVIGGTNICLRYLDPENVFDNIVIHKVTHMCGAPSVMNMIVNSLDFNMKNLHHTVNILTSGAPPPRKFISKIKELGFHVSHIYGLTENYGTGTWSLLNGQSDLIPLEECVMKFKAPQGVKHFSMKGVEVKNPITRESLKCDGESIGDVMFRGNTIMGGYLKNLRKTEEAFSGRWLHREDLDFKQADKYIERTDRSKDIVISGVKNICTIEIEDVIYSHPAVLEVAVVARPDYYCGQAPCAFVKLKDGVYVDSQEVIQHCRDRMPKYMVPWSVIFEDLPKNETGRVQKCVSRKKAKCLGPSYLD